ncbi:MAG TPA: type II CRISPR-associated endonuclease Cas1 [Acidiphilium sp.]
MSYRTVEIGSPARLSLRHRQMVIAREDGSAPTVPIEDLDILLLAEPRITCSGALLVSLAEAKVATIICGTDYMPTGVLLPYAGNVLSGERLRAQLACPKPLSKRLWQTIIVCKLRRQGDLLASVTGTDAGLSAMARRVRSGDPDNLEAQGAQRYWPRLLGAKFRRDRTGEPPNHLLNYGYAVLRAATARAIVSAGLQAGIGLFHANRGDAFALASDLMEPFRPFVDGVVWELSRDGAAAGDLDRTCRTHLLSILNRAVAIDGQTMPLSLALTRTATSLAESFVARKSRLKLPEGADGLPGHETDHAAPPAAS